jgi:multiple sugar transport system substrate-binding protein
MGERLRAPLALVIVLITAALVTGCGGGGDSGKPTLNWYTFNEPSGAFQIGVKNCNKEAGDRYEIKLVPLPTNADQQRELLVRRLAAEDESVDLVGMDVIWTAEFAEAGWIRPWDAERTREIEANTLKGPLETAKYKGKLYAVPHNSNTQLLWYRKDRVQEPPETWDEMFDEAEKIGADGKIQVQGARYEGYVVWFNTLVESAGGSILTPEGDVALGAPAERAIEVINKLANSPAADPGLTNNKEDQARLNFQNGGSTFMVNYPFVYASAKKETPDIAKNMGAAPYPAVEPGQPAKVTLGGLNVGVSQFSKDPELAFEAALCLRNEENQIVNVEEGGLPPTIESLYDTPEVDKAYPEFKDLIKQGIENGTPRPVTPAYSDISLTIQQTLHPPGEISAKEALETLKERIGIVKDGGIY